MNRTAGAMLLVAALGGCTTMDHGPEMGGPASQGVTGCYRGGGSPIAVPGVQGPWGQPVAMAAPYSSSPPPGDMAARAMLSHSVPLNMVQMAGAARPSPSGDIVQAAYMPGTNPQGVIMPAGGLMTPPGVPPAPGMAPGAGMPVFTPQTGMPAPGGVAAAGALPAFMPSRFPTQRTEVRFVRPNGMRVTWFTAAGGRAGFATTQIVAPGRYNFPQGAIYRLRLSDIPGRPQMVLYPTLEVVPSNGKTDPFLAHSAVPVEFTNEDFDQVAAGNYVVKVIYLPNPAFQDVAVPGGLEEIVSSRLEPGVDPLQEAQRRGSVLLVIRMGNIDLELNNSPPMNAPSPYACPPGAPGGPSMGQMGMFQGYGVPMTPYSMPGMGHPPLGPGGMLPPVNGNGTKTGAAPSQNWKAPPPKPQSAAPRMPAGPGPEVPEVKPATYNGSSAPGPFLPN